MSTQPLTISDELIEQIRSAVKGLEHMDDVANAIVDALAPLGVTDVGTPATPEKVWQAIQSA